MKEAKALYLISPPGERRNQAVRSLALPTERVFDDTGSFLPLESREPGVVVLPPRDLPAPAVVEVIVACMEAGPSWIPALLHPDRGEAVTLGPGFAYELADLARRAAGEDRSPVLTLPDVLERVRAARHDINNPLAAALAETQLLRMDAEGEALVEALDVIEAQLRRIRDLVSSLHGLRPPSRPSERGSPPGPVV